MKIQVAAAVAVLIFAGAARVEAALLNFHFEGWVAVTSGLPDVSENQKVHGDFSFDPALARPTSPVEAPGTFDLPGMRIDLHVGPYTVQGIQGPSNHFTSHGFLLSDLTHSIAGAGLAGNLNISAAATQPVFDQDPIFSLNDGRWENINQGGRPAGSTDWSFDYFVDGNRHETRGFLSSIGCR